MGAKVTTKWTGGLAFEAGVSGHPIPMDADSEWGGQDKGARPKQLLLAAISGCSGMDIVSILNKMQLPPYKFVMDAEAESTSEHPIVYHTIKVNFIFEGDDLPKDKIIKAVKLSTEKYCGVIAMLKKASNIIIKITINNQEVM